MIFTTLVFTQCNTASGFFLLKTQPLGVDYTVC